MNTRKYSTEIADAVKSYLMEEDWNFSFDQERGVFRFVVRIGGRIKELLYTVKVKKDAFIVYTNSPIGPDDNDKDMMSRMADYVCRCNFGLRHGCFELDMNDGELRYKYSADCEDIIPSKAIIENSIHCPSAMFAHYSSGFVSVMFEEADPEKAYEQCEKDRERELRELLSELRKRRERPSISELISEVTEEPGTEEAAVTEETGTDDQFIKPDLFGSEGEEDAG